MIKPCNECPSKQYLEMTAREKSANRQATALNSRALEQCGLGDRISGRRSKILGYLLGNKNMAKHFDLILSDELEQNVIDCTGPFERTSPAANSEGEVHLWRDRICGAQAVENLSTESIDIDFLNDNSAT